MFFRNQFHHGRGPGPGRQFGPWMWQGRFFERGELPIALLSLLSEGPQHGYQLMKSLEERSGGTYRASAGTIYPILQQLQDQGFVTSQSEEGGKRVYRITAEGRAELEEHADVAAGIWNRAQQDEWNDWQSAFHPDSADLVGPAFRLMKAAFRAVKAANRDPERIEQVRDILKKAREKLDDLVDEKKAR